MTISSSVRMCLCACVLIVSALSGPGAASAVDLRSPDARAAAPTSSLPGSTSRGWQDLRTPDSRDAATRSSHGPVVHASSPRPAPDSSGDAEQIAIALGAVAVLIITTASGALLRRVRVRRGRAFRGLA